MVTCLRISCNREAERYVRMVNSYGLNQPTEGLVMNEKTQPESRPKQTWVPRSISRIRSAYISFRRKHIQISGGQRKENFKCYAGEGTLLPLMNTLPTFWIFSGNCSHSRVCFCWHQQTKRRESIRGAQEIYIF